MINSDAVRIHELLKRLSDNELMSQHQMREVLMNYARLLCDDRGENIICEFMNVRV